MAGLPSVRRIMMEDYKDAPAWLSKLVYSLNLFLDSIYTALNKNLTFVDNVRAQIISMSVLAGAAAINCTTYFATTMPAVRGVLILSAIQQGNTYTPLTAAPTVASWRVSAGTIFIDSITGLTSGQTYTITFLVI